MNLKKKTKRKKQVITIKIVEKIGDYELKIQGLNQKCPREMKCTPLLSNYI